MSIKFGQLRISSTLANAALEAYTDGSLGAQSIRVAADGTTLERSTSGLQIAATAAGDGLQGGGGSALAVDVSAFAGTGLEDDGSENLRIAASAAGAGLTGGAGSALAVGAGTGISVAADSVAIDTGSTVAFSGESWSFSNGGITVAGSSFSSTDVVNADFVLSQVAAGVAWKFPILSASQLDDTNDAVSQAGVFFLQEQPTSGDTLVVTDGTTTRTYGAGTGGDVQYTIGADVDETLGNLASAITGDGAGLWDAVLETTLQSINGGTGSVTAGLVVVIYRANQSSNSFDDRMYGTFSSGVPTTITYNGESDSTAYTKTTTQALPGADPSQKDFGPGDSTPIAGQAHVTLDDDSQYVWDADGTAWTQISGTGSITAGTGLTKSGNTVHVGDGTTGASAGINFLADDIEVALEAAGVGEGGLAFDNNEIRINLEAAGAGTGGLELTASGLAVLDGDGIEQTASGIAVDLEAAGAGTGGLAFDAGELRVFANTSAGIALSASGVGVNLEAAGAGAGGLEFNAGAIRIDVDGTSTGTTASVLNLNANGLAISVDDSTIEGSGAGGSLQVKALGIDTAQLAADAVTEAKLGVSFREEEFAASAFALSSGNYVVSLAKEPLVTTKTQFFAECYRNGVADMTNTGTTDPTTATEFRLVGGGTDELQIGADITGSGDTFRVRYLSADLTA